MDSQRLMDRLTRVAGTYRLANAYQHPVDVSTLWVVELDSCADVSRIPFRSELASLD